LPGPPPVGALHAWLERVSPFAFGMLGLRPWELLRYTPREFGWMVKGWRTADERERLLFAQLAVWMLSPWISKGHTLTARQLVGLERREDL